ncbi:MAG: amylo-alpha-1,6-glucosidase [Deltaproteobacteria bacterium]|nr:amylo-alpha-1,6-glucosidase [Deltaproteobacteria bacterium]
MTLDNQQSIDEATSAAIDVLLHNTRTGRSGLPRTAGWGYPEPYTRDLMIASLGVLVSGNAILVNALKKTLQSLSEHQSPLGLIPGIADDSNDLGASDTTPLFLFGLAACRHISGDLDFLAEAAASAMCWNQYQSPSDRVLIAQQPTSDWRDEQWVHGYGLYINTLLYACLKLFGHHVKAAVLHDEINKPVTDDDNGLPGVREGLLLSHASHYALWSYKIYSNDRFDLLGNSLAILTGIASRRKAELIIDWVESSCVEMKNNFQLSGNLAPNLFPYIVKGDIDWRDRYEKFNNPGQYHNGGIWPFVCGFHIAALVAAGRQKLAERNLEELTEICRLSKRTEMKFGFNEWIRAQDGTVAGEDWQLWSASMYVYAAHCVETKSTPLFDTIRKESW